MPLGWLCRWVGRMQLLVCRAWAQWARRCRARRLPLWWTRRTRRPHWYSTSCMLISSPIKSPSSNSRPFDASLYVYPLFTFHSRPVPSLPFPSFTCRSFSFPLLHALKHTHQKQISSTSFCFSSWHEVSYADFLFERFVFPRFLSSPKAYFQIVCKHPLNWCYRNFWENEFVEFEKWN